MDHREQFELPASALRWRCDPESFAFESTAEVDRLQEFVGQDRALRAIQFGLAIDRPGYNIFVTGLTGTGRASAIKSYVERTVETKMAGPSACPVFDWCYVYNFEDADRPVALRLPQGRGSALRIHMDTLVRGLKDTIERAFSHESYENARQKIIASVQERLKDLWQEVEGEARRRGFLLQVSPTEVGLIPLVDDKPATQAQALALSEQERARLEEHHGELMELVGEAMQKANQLRNEGQEQLEALDKRVTDVAVAGPFSTIMAQYQDLPDVVAFLERVRAHTLDNLSLFRKREAAPNGQPLPLQIALPVVDDPMRAYRVNVFVDNSKASGPPIVVEQNPTFGNLFGRIERRSVMGGLVTDHTMLKPGSLALANGGYLVANAHDIFVNLGVWEGLKRAIRSKELRLEEDVEALGLKAPQGMKPQPIPLEVKVILLGDDMLYRLASTQDSDFWEMFKVKAEFDTQIDRTPENANVYATFIARSCEQDQLLHFDRGGVAAAVEHAARIVGDQNKLSTRFGQLRDLLVESSYFARQDGSQAVSARHVRQAIEEKIQRLNLVQGRIQELVATGVLLVDVDGAVVGQVNGLAVYDLGDIAFGQPSRITARTFAGRGGVVNIEREARLSGKTHDKGVLILTGYLGSRFAQNQPLSLSASLCFEQSYEGIDGDSASSTELYAILSSLSHLPIDQSLAVTGSVNQNGEVQAIGGVNEKVEGFYDICLAKGFTGRQGVLVPRANVRHMMLRPDIVEAVAAGKFHVYAVETVDQGIELLTGKPLGQPAADGSYPEGTVGNLVMARLSELAKAVRGADKDREREGSDEKKESPCSGDDRGLSYLS